MGKDGSIAYQKIREQDGLRVMPYEEEVIQGINILRG